MGEKENGFVKIIPILRKKVDSPELPRDKCYLSFADDTQYKENLAFLVNVILGRLSRKM